MALASFDDLAELVLAKRIVAIALQELLLIAERKRATQSVLARINRELLQRRLETYPRLTTRAGIVRVFRRDAGVAAVFDAVLNPSAEGDVRLARTNHGPLDGIAHDLADLLALTEHATLEGLCQSVTDYSDGVVWAHLAGEDEWTRSEDHSRKWGLHVHNCAHDWIQMEYPFPVSDFWDATAELEVTNAFRYRLNDLYEDSDVDWGSLVDYYLHLGLETRVRGSSSEVWGDGPLELVSRKDEAEVAIARFLKSGEIQFRLGSDDVKDLSSQLRFSARGQGKRELVAAQPDDLELVEDLILRASAKRTREQSG